MKRRRRKESQHGILSQVKAVPPAAGDAGIFVEQVKRSEDMSRNKEPDLDSLKEYFGNISVTVRRNGCWR